MSKLVICNFLEWIHISDVEKTEEGGFTVKAGKKFTRVFSKTKLTYREETANTDAGMVSAQTVTFSSDIPSFAGLKNPLESYILRLTHSGGTITVGHPDYPAVKSFTTNNSMINASFICNSPL